MPEFKGWFKRATLFCVIERNLDISSFRICSKSTCTVLTINQALKFQRCYKTITPRYGLSTFACDLWLWENNQSYLFLNYLDLCNWSSHWNHLTSPTNFLFQLNSLSNFSSSFFRSLETCTGRSCFSFETTHFLLYITTTLTAQLHTAHHNGKEDQYFFLKKLTQIINKKIKKNTSLKTLLSTGILLRFKFQITI